jgi:predicted TIM-barrel enzyme
MGSGVLSENLLGLCSFADGFFIDSHIREEGLISKPIDRNKLDRLSVMAEQIRHTLA